MDGFGRFNIRLGMASYVGRAIMSRILETLGKQLTDRRLMHLHILVAVYCGCVHSC
jgi:hypothetical protein